MELDDVDPVFKYSHHIFPSLLDYTRKLESFLYLQGDIIFKFN
jgi:hypothetical protein